MLNIVKLTQNFLWKDLIGNINLILPKHNCFLVKSITDIFLIIYNFINAAIIAIITKALEET